MSFAPEEIAAEIQKHLPEFTISYKPDFRQQIAESWIENMDDSCARNDWGWNPKYDLKSMTEDMIFNLNKLQKNKNYDETRFL
jgi:nucleoside-diphosphate-sugar epimerase